MKPSQAVCVSDLKEAARRHLPRIMFDYIEGGAEDEACITRNAQRFQDIRLVPRYLRDVVKRDQTVRLFDQSFNHPFGIAPTGMAGMVRRDADLHLAAAAAETNAPFILSGASNSSIEKIARIHPGAWYQIYLSGNPAINEDLLRRAEGAGLPTLVVTVDVPAHSKRERAIRAGWVRPYKPTLSTRLEALKHPGWVWRYLWDGLPYLENWQVYAEPGATAMEVAGIYAKEVPSLQTWETIQLLRQRWQGRLVLKGIMHPEDARLAVAAGVDGIIVSNHGGRQFDRSPAPVDVFPSVCEAVGGAIPLMIDSGVTRGTDIISAFCLGAAMAFVGRASLYGVAAFGRRGVDRTLAILAHEVDIGLAQIGAGSINALDASYLWRASGPIETMPTPAKT